MKEEEKKMKQAVISQYQKQRNKEKTPIIIKAQQPQTNKKEEPCILRGFDPTFHSKPTKNQRSDGPTRKPNPPSNNKWPEKS